MQAARRNERSSRLVSNRPRRDKRRSEKHVLVFAGGGLSPVSGGVGTLLRYLIAAWALDSGNLAVRVIDTRGAGGPVPAAMRFVAGGAALVWSRVTGRAACAHIHMTTRGSAWRKSLLCALSRLVGLPTVLHLHGADFFDFHAGLPRPARFVLRACIARAECVVVIGTAWRDRLVDELAVPLHRTRIVRNGVPAVPPVIRGGDGRAQLLFLGRIGARKGVPELIEAMASVTLAGRAWQATIAGDGDGAALAALVAEAGLQGRVALPGWLDPAQAALALSRADILVLPSRHEVMPVAILEAMAHGLAIVATPVGAIPEILQDGVNARLVPAGDAAALASALAALIDDPAARLRLGDQARQDFAARLDIGIPAAALQAIYREVAAPDRYRAAA